MAFMKMSVEYWCNVLIEKTGSIARNPVAVPLCPRNAVYSDNHGALMNTMCGQIISPEKPRRRGENNTKVCVNSTRARALD